MQYFFLDGFSSLFGYFWPEFFWWHFLVRLRKRFLMWCLLVDLDDFWNFLVAKSFSFGVLCWVLFGRVFFFVWLFLARIFVWWHFLVRLRQRFLMWFLFGNLDNFWNFLVAKSSCFGVCSGVLFERVFDFFGLLLGQIYFEDVSVFVFGRGFLCGFCWEIWNFLGFFGGVDVL